MDIISSYGYVWQPHVSRGFHPYRTSGYWVWSPEYQWIWVSDYEWAGRRSIMAAGIMIPTMVLWIPDYDGAGW
jgi:hypothetical protein